MIDLAPLQAVLAAIPTPYKSLQVEDPTYGGWPRAWIRTEEIVPSDELPAAYEMSVAITTAVRGDGTLITESTFKLLQAMQGVAGLTFVSADPPEITAEKHLLTAAQTVRFTLLLCE